VGLLGGEKALNRLYFHLKPPVPFALNIGDALRRFPAFVVRIVDPGLVLSAVVVALGVLFRGVDDGEISEEDGVEGKKLRVVFDPHRLPVTRSAGADGLVRGRLAGGPVGIAAGSRNYAGQGLHELLHPPETPAGQIDDTDAGRSPEAVVPIIVRHSRSSLAIFLFIVYIL
jgi:hypothetical protein